MGILCLIGDGITQDAKKAAEWFHLAAQNGHIGAYFNLANMYYEGMGVERNLKEAAEWFRKAAEQGDVTAKEKLLQMEQAKKDQEEVEQSQA